MSEEWFQQILLLDPYKVIVDREGRQRRDLDTDDLQASIQTRGQLQPIVVESQDGGASYKLIVGERRLSSCRNLGINVKALEISQLTPIELQIIELDENIKRSDLAWQDQAAAVARIHAMFILQDEEWTLGETSKEIGLSLSVISESVRITREIAEGNSRLSEAASRQAAANMLSRRDSRASSAALEDLIAPVRVLPQPEIAAPITAISGYGGNPPPGVQNPAIPAHTAINLPVSAAPFPPAQPPIPPIPSASETLLHASFADWIASYDGPLFNFLHCDFPYGINFNSGPQGKGAEPTEGYNDDKDVYWALIDALLGNINRVASLSCHVMFWYSEQHGPETKRRFAEAGFKVQVHPLIWLKSDNAGISPDPKRKPRHIYETALLMTRGDRQIVKIKGDAYAAPTAKHLHPSCKPAPVLRYFFEMLVDDHTTMLDPTCGSATSIQAAESWGAKRTLGLERDLEFLTPARSELQKFRNLKGSAKALGL